MGDYFVTVAIALPNFCKATSTSCSVTIKGGTKRTTFGPAGTSNKPSSIAALTISIAVRGISANNSIPLIKPHPRTSAMC